ncbi:hypothetical protein [Streptomyces sp. NPDC019224]|uniref:hypothetical protein n=1 Tax=Streptomyces sp. NPDC019224 TaxID=3154484 RepID=UPI0033DA430B
MAAVRSQRIWRSPAVLAVDLAESRRSGVYRTADQLALTWSATEYVGQRVGDLVPAVGECDVAEASADAVEIGRVHR